jgi:hypothetical protein
VVLLIAASFDPVIAAAGWLAAFVTVVSVPVGSLSLLLIGRLTGGRWIDALAPVLRPASRLIPYLALGLLPLFLALPLLYPWAVHGAEDELIGRFYRNVPFMIGRSLIAFMGWSLLAVGPLPSLGHKGQIVAGLGLVFHAVITTFVAFDWILALSPRFVSSSFGGATAIEWILAALAFGTLIGKAADPRTEADISGLLIACLAAILYFGLMEFLIIWYGNQAETAAFFLDRGGPLGLSLLIAAFVIGAIFPMAALLFSAIRRDRRRLRGVALLILIGITLHQAWRVLPPFGLWAVACAAVALTTLIAALAAAHALAVDLQQHRGEAGHGT